MQHFIELSAVVNELSCVQKKNSAEIITVRRHRADSNNNQAATDTDSSLGRRAIAPLNLGLSENCRKMLFSSNKIWSKMQNFGKIFKNLWFEQFLGGLQVFFI